MVIDLFRPTGFTRECRRCGQLFIPFTKWNRVCLDCKKKGWEETKKKIKEMWRKKRNGG